MADPTFAPTGMADTVFVATGAEPLPAASLMFICLTKNGLEMAFNEPPIHGVNLSAEDHVRMWREHPEIIAIYRLERML
jgi:hypothetical protein